VLNIQFFYSNIWALDVYREFAIIKFIQIKLFCKAYDFMKIMSTPRSMHLKHARASWSVRVFIIEVTWPFRWYLFGLMAVQMLWAVDLTLRQYIIKWILNAAVQGPSDVLSYRLALLSALFCATLGIVIGAFRVYDWLNMRMQPMLRKHIADRLMQYALGHGHAFYQQHMSGGLANHVNNVVRSIPEMLQAVIERFLVVSVAVLIALGSMARFHSLLAWAIGLWILIFIGISLLAVKKAQFLARAASQAQSDAIGSVTDAFANMMSVRLFTGELHEVALLNDTFAKTARAERARDWLLLKVRAFHTFSFLVLEVLTLTILVRGVSAGWVTPGDFSLVLGINFSLIWILWGFMQDLITFIKAFGEIAQGLKALTVPYEMVDAPNAPELQVTRGEIVFQQVTFAYSAHNIIFTDLSLDIQAGQKVGLVGYSGSGKSTFVNLILRLYDIQRGDILIDGQSIASVTQDSLRRSIALIPQDPSLFHRSLRENIRYGRPSASDAEILAAARHAHADEFIERMLHKYDTLVGERGLTLSGGQRQRIAIARAFLKEAPILLLDEATSALDSITESYIQDSLEQLMQGRTTLVIAHRLSTLMHMDRILVFDQGRIVEDGSHQVLLSQKGYYYALWTAQINGFLPDH
jgi:ATP-binding cassette subfamily B protein